MNCHLTPMVYLFFWDAGDPRGQGVAITATKVIGEDKPLTWNVPAASPPRRVLEDIEAIGKCLAERIEAQSCQRGSRTSFSFVETTPGTHAQLP